MKKLIEQLKEHEGSVRENGRHFPYKCPAGKLTLGYGRNIEANGISEDEALRLLSDDLRHRKTTLMTQYPFYTGQDITPEEFANTAKTTGRHMPVFVGSETYIGYGRIISVYGISEDEAEFLLMNDVKNSALEVKTALPWTEKLNEARRSVIINMAFNMGLRTLLTFKNTLRYAEKGDYEATAKGMLNSLWAKQVKGRATELAEQMRTGAWEERWLRF